MSSARVELVVFDPYVDVRSGRTRFRVHRRDERGKLVVVEATNADRIRSEVLGCVVRAVGAGDAMRLRLAVDAEGEVLFPTAAEAAEREAREAREAEREAREAEREAESRAQAEREARRNLELEARPDARGDRAPAALTSAGRSTRPGTFWYARRAMRAPLLPTIPTSLLAATSLFVLSACAPTQERCVDATTAAPAETAAVAPAPAPARAGRGAFFLGNAREVVEKNPIGPDEKTKLVPLFENANHTVNVIQTRGTVPLHYHAEHDEHVVILEGSGTFTVEGKTRGVKAGDVQIIPRGAVHSYVHEGPGVTVVVSTFSPKFDPKDRIMVDPKKP